MTLSTNPIPPQKPAVEIGELIDDIVVQAILLADVTVVRQQASFASGAVRDRQDCLALARRLAGSVGASISRRSDETVFIEGAGIADASLMCPHSGRSSPSLSVSWEKGVRLP